MFLGHVAVGLAGKRVAPRASLGTLLFAPLFLDALWPVFLAVGIERVRIEPASGTVNPLIFEHYPWSHSLLFALIWSVLFALIYRWRRAYTRGAIWLGAAVASHWFLDAIVHVPDLPLAPGLNVKVGLGLWRSLPATLAIEGLLFAAGIVIYLRAARPQDALGWVLFFGFIAFLVLAYVSTLFGPPPPNLTTLIISAIALWILVPWAAWIDRHSTVRV